MRTLLAALALAFTTPALAENAPKKHRYDCVFPDKTTEVVEAPDDEAARNICRDLWNKAKRAGRHTNGTKTGGGVEDDLFSRRSL